MCHYLNINSANLIHVDAKKRLLDILKEHEKLSDHDTSIGELCEIFRAVGNKNSAHRLLRVAQEQLESLDDRLHSSRSHYKAPQRDHLLSEEVLDSDLDSSSSEDWVMV